MAQKYNLIRFLLACQKLRPGEHEFVLYNPYYNPLSCTSGSSSRDVVALNAMTSLKFEQSSTSDWSPLDDGITIRLPSSSNETPSRKAIDEHIQRFLYGPMQKKKPRLPIFIEICPKLGRTQLPIFHSSHKQRYRERERRVKGAFKIQCYRNQYNSFSYQLTRLAAMDNKRKLSFKRASFIKVLEDEFTKKLPLPPAFTKIFEDYIPPWLILEISGTRKCWRVDIEEDENGSLCLSCGFDSFVKAHSVEVGNFLLFELEEPSILQVKIYEKDGSEKKVGTTLESGYEVGAFESPRKTLSTHKEGEASPWPTTPLGTNFESGYEIGAFESPTETPVIHKEGEASPLAKTPSVQNGAYQMQPSFIDRSTRKKCILSATKHGLCFSLTWRKANHFIYYLTIPKAMLNGKALSNKEAVTLQNQEGSSWPVELRFRADGRVDLAKGWREFVIDNELITGDTLNFEFVSNNVIQVNVGRASQVDNPSQREQECKIEPTEFINMTCESEELAANCIINNNGPVTMDKFVRVSLESKSPSFSLTWTEKTRNSHMHIPKAIANRQKLENKDIVVLCDPEGRKWLMEVRTRQSDGRVGLGRGWVDFAKTYGFGAGDTLIFEFVTDRMMNVNIIKAGGLNHAVTGDIDKATSVEGSVIAQKSQNSPWVSNAKSLL